MAKVMAVLAVLLVGSSAFGASLTVAGWGFETNYDPTPLNAADPENNFTAFYVDIQMTGLPESGASLCGISLGVTLSGSGAYHVAPVPNTPVPPATVNANRYSGATGDALVDPDVYAWDYSTSASNSMDTGTGRVTFLFLDDSFTPTQVYNGDTVARLHFAWDGSLTHPPEEEIVVMVGGEEGGQGAYVVTGDLDFVDVDGSFSQPIPIPVPEPASMALVGLGIVGLLLSKKR